MGDSYRIDSPQKTYPADLDSTWLGGEPYQGSKIKPQPLSTSRLKVFRQVTRGAILSILETGHVSIEFLKKKGDQERLAEIFVVSGDGQEICVEQWKTDTSVGSANLSAPTGDIERTWKTFTFSSLPEKYWKKYTHACRFVDLVKSKTAKVTMYSDRAKGILMENWPPNFEATFFHGPKIVMYGNEVHIKEDSGASLMFHRDSLNHLVNNYTMDLIQHATQMREQCQRLEASVVTVQAMSQNNESLFPVTVGMRPSTSFCSSTSSNSGSIDFLSSPRFSHLHSSPPSGSQGHPASPPPSPGPQINLRCTDSPARHTPASHPSPMDSLTSQSPFRHISTLEGRKLRRQISDSSGSSYIQHSNARPAAQSNPDFSHASPYLQDKNGDVCTGHGLANSFCGTENELNQQISLQALKSSKDQVFIVPSVMAASQQIPKFNQPQSNQVACDTNLKRQTVNQLISLGAEQGKQCTKHNVTFGSSNTMAVDGNVTGPYFTADTQSTPTSVVKNATSADKDVDEETSPVVRQTFVAYTGWASQLVNGTIWIRYNEGTQLGVYRDQPEVVYVDQQGNRHRYLQSDNIPEVVRQKLEKLPIVIEGLKKRPSATAYTPAST